mmetsp:Transcript_17398/g.36978  ORF Transcript_17398/g.36978 Transcript_17398/m.36978 type:complete len:320 (-) Transcript_17398:43-1002(-)
MSLKDRLLHQICLRRPLALEDLGEAFIGRRSPSLEDMPRRRKAFWRARLQDLRVCHFRRHLLRRLFFDLLQLLLLSQHLHATAFKKCLDALVLAQAPIFTEGWHRRKRVLLLLELSKDLFVLGDSVHHPGPHALEVFIHLPYGHESASHRTGPQHVLLLLDEELVDILDGIGIRRWINLRAIVLELPTIPEPVLHTLGMELLGGRDGPQRVLLEDVIMLRAPLRNAGHCAAIGHLHRRCGAWVVVVGSGPELRLRPVLREEARCQELLRIVRVLIEVGGPIARRGRIGCDGSAAEAARIDCGLIAGDPAPPVTIWPEAN